MGLSLCLKGLESECKDIIFHFFLFSLWGSHRVSSVEPRVVAQGKKANCPKSVSDLVERRRETAASSARAPAQDQARTRRFPLRRAAGLWLARRRRAGLGGLAAGRSRCCCCCFERRFTRRKSVQHEIQIGSPRIHQLICSFNVNLDLTK